MEKLGRSPTVLYIALNREEAMQRLLQRMTCKGCGKIYPADYKELTCQNCNGELYKRSDDNEEAITKRIDVFFDETVPIIENYRSQDRLIEINGYCKNTNHLSVSWP